MKKPPITSRPPSRLRGGWLLRIVVLMLAIATVTAAFFAARAPASSGKHALAQLTEGQYWTVQRGPLLISMVAPGSVKAKNSAEIKCLFGERDAKIIWITEEGSVAKMGDKLIELESPGLKEDLVKQRISVTNAQSDYDSATENLAVRESQNRTDLVIAQNKYDMAELDLEKYLKGDSKQQLREKESAIKLAEAMLKRARDRVEGTSKLLKKGYVNRGELEADQLELTKQEIELDKARNDKELLEKYEYKRETSRLNAEKRGALEELERTKRVSAGELQNKKIAVEAAKAKLNLEKLQFKNLETVLANTVVYAPQEGMVVYAQGNRGDENARVQVGIQVRNQQKLIDLPDFSAWQVETRVHESRIQQIKLGQKALITVDSFQGRTIEATVAKIAVLPDSTRWFMPDTKEYLVQLDLTTTTLPLKPGMSAKTEVLLNSLQDVLYVPIQAVTTAEGRTVVWRRGETGPARQFVEVGSNNDRFVEIRAGLNEGDVIVMQNEESGGANIFKRPSDDGAPEKKKDATENKPEEKAKPARLPTAAGDKAATVTVSEAGPAVKQKASPL